MGLLASSFSMTRYHVQGTIEKPIVDSVAKRLTQFAIPEQEHESIEPILGWTSVEDPYHPDFNTLSFSVGTLMTFALRIDKKSIPPKTLKKYYCIELAKKIAASGREFLTAHEKKMIKDHVINVLSLRIPATPHIYELVWDYEKAEIWFFSNLKSANEALESLFFQTFKLTLMRKFPYTMAYNDKKLNNTQKDRLQILAHSSFIA
jgi:hypothetical protein